MLFSITLALALVWASKSPLERSPFNAVGKGWQSFAYRETGTEVSTAFSLISSRDPIIVRITDLASPGSAFRVLANGRRVLVTPIPLLDREKGPTVNPLRAYNSNAWSHGHTVLPPGFHHIRIFMRFSAADSGLGGFIAEGAERCPEVDGDLFLVSNLVDWDSAAKVCAGYGGKLAELKRPYGKGTARHAKLLQRAFSLLKRCQVEGDMAWIAGSVNNLFPEEGEFPASIKAYSEQEGLTGAEWEMSQLATLCQRV